MSRGRRIPANWHNPPGRATSWRRWRIPGRVDKVDGRVDKVDAANANAGMPMLAMGRWGYQR